MPIKINKEEGHYYHYFVTTSNAPSLTLTGGKIRYWVRSNNESGTVSWLIRDKEMEGHVAHDLPLPSGEKSWHTLFIQGLDAVNSKYRFNGGGASIASEHRKILEGLTREDIVTSFGRFSHRAESSYIP